MASATSSAYTLTPRTPLLNMSNRADLSHVLALHYGLKVVGIDAEETSTRGAEVQHHAA